MLAAVLALTAACGGGDDDGSADGAAASLLITAGAVTRSESPFSFVQTLRTETADGQFLEQRTEGIYDGEADRAVLVVTTEGTATAVFTADTTVQPGSTVRIVIDGQQVYLRVDVVGLDDTPWTAVTPSADGPTAEGTISVLGSALVANVADAEQVGDIGSETVGGVATTRYAVTANAAEAAIYLPTETLDLLVEQGLRRDRVRARARFDYWLDDAGRIRRIRIDHTPLVEELAGDLFEPGAEVTSLQHTFEIVQFGGVEVAVPGPDDIADTAQ
jgi:hypothetical protein